MVYITTYKEIDEIREPYFNLIKCDGIFCGKYGDEAIYKEHIKEKDKLYLVLTNMCSCDFYNTKSKNYEFFSNLLTEKLKFIDEIALITKLFLIYTPAFQVNPKLKNEINIVKIDSPNNFEFTKIPRDNHCFLIERDYTEYNKIKNKRR
jgi:hypothetical protein